MSEMTRQIDSRELITLDETGPKIVATYHKARNPERHWAGGQPQGAATGVLFLNSMSPTRAAAGDSSVYWADAIAQCGFPTFRIDFPGFGDSMGEPPAGLLNHIDTGGYAALVADKAREITKRYGLSGVILVGLCSGAVSAIYAAAAHSECKGLILMDPYFHLPLKRPSKLWQKLTGRLSRTSFALTVTKWYERAAARIAALTGGAIPANANGPLLHCWKNIATTGMPILLFRAPGFRQRGEFDYLRHILKLAGRRGKVQVKAIEGAGHTFSNRKGRQAVRESVANWLQENFAAPARDERALGLGHRIAREKESKHITTQAAPADIGCALEGR